MEMLQSMIKDPEFQALDDDTKVKTLTNYFDNNVKDDAEFHALDTDTKTKTKNNFINETLKDVRSQAKMDKIDEYVPDFAEDFVHGAAKNVANYTASAAKLMGDKELQDKANRAVKTLDRNIDSKGVALVGEIAGDPLNLAPAGVFTKGSKLARVGKSLAGGAAVGAATMAAKDYGNDTLTDKEKEVDMRGGAVLTSALNGIIAAVTKGRIIDPIKTSISDTADPQKISDNILAHADELGLTATEAKQASDEIATLQQQYPKVPDEFKTEQAGKQPVYEPDFQIKPTHPPATIEQVDELDKIDAGFQQLQAEINGNGIVELKPTTKTVEEQIQENEVMAQESLRKAKFEKSLDNTEVANKHEEDAKKYLNAAQQLKAKAEELQTHPRYQELLDMRRDVNAKDAQAPQKLVNKREIVHENTGNGFETKVIPAQYEKNYANDFELTKQDVKNIEAGKADENTIAKLETDLGTLDNHPDYTPNQSTGTTAANNIMSAKDWEEANALFSKGADNLAVAAYAGVNEDENGNITFDPEKFIIGLGGYTAVKTALKSGAVRGKLKEYAQKAIDTVDMNPQVQKKNGLNSMFVGTNGKEAGAFSDTATQKTMKEIDDANAKVVNGTWGTSEDMKFGNSTVAKLDEILKHKELFKQYPELKDTIVHLKPDMQGASFDAPANRIIVGYDTKTKNINKSSLLHEIQHAIQNKEGWAKGGSPDAVTPKELASTLTDKYGDLPAFQKIEEDFLNSKIKTEDDMYTKMINLASENYGGIEKLKLDTYKRLHGEQQARAAQYRENMTPEEKSAETWQDTLKRVEGEYHKPIVKFDDGGITEMSPVDNQAQRKIKSAVKKALTTKTNTKLELGSLDEDAVKKVFDETKINLKGFSRYMDGNHIRHTIKEHGNTKRELERGQIPVTEDDIAKIPEITSSFDKVTKSTITDNKGKKRTRLVFQKTYDDGIIRYVEATDFRNKKLSLKTMYKKKIGETAKNSKKSVVTDLKPSQQSGGGATQSFNENIIPQNTKKGKGLLARTAEKRKQQGLPEKGSFVYHPERKKEYYLSDDGMAYFKRANGTYREMPNESIIQELHQIKEDGIDNFLAKRKQEDKQLDDALNAADARTKEESYKMEHTAPVNDEVNSRADDVSQSFSDDIYSKDAQRLHGHGNPQMDEESILAIHKAKGNPESEITIYRAIPKSAKDGINPKDWVTISKEYAKSHGESVLKGDYKIVSKKVQAKDLWTDGNSIHEWGYDPATKPTKLMANGMHSMAGGFAGATDSVINQRDYDGDGVYTYKDLLMAAATGAIGINAFKKLAPKLFEEEAHNAKVQIGTFAGEKFKKARAKGYEHIRKIVADEALKEWGDASSTLKRNFTDTLSAKYHDLRESTTSSVNGETVKLERLHNALKELSEEDRTALHNFVTGETSEINQAIKPLAKSIKKQIHDLSKMLVEKKVLGENEFKEWEDHYVHRSYEKHFLSDVKSLIGKGFKIDEIHKRGKVEVVSEAKAKKFLGEVEPSLLKKPLRDGGIRVKTLGNGKVEIRRDWTPQEREAMKEITDGSITIPDTLMRLKRLNDNADFLKNIAALDDVVLKDAKNMTAEELDQIGYALAPNSAKYGVLAGQAIRKDVLNDIKGINHEIFNTFGNDGVLARLWKNYLTTWKKSKTVWNIPSHVNNFMSNTFLMHLAGMNSGQIVTAIGRAGKMMIHGNAYEELLKKKMLGIATEKDLQQLDAMGEDLKYFIEAKEGGLLGHSQLNDILAGQQNAIDKTAKQSLLKKADKFAQDAYHNGDAINRIAMYAHLREKEGLSPDEARKMVLAVMPDYSKPMPQGYKFLRDTGISPFISWTYYTMPTVLKMLKTKKGSWQALKALGTLSALEWALTGGEITPLDNIPFMDTKKPEDFKGRRFAININKDKVTTIKTDRWIPYVELLNPLNFVVSQLGGVTTKAITNVGTSLSRNGIVDTYTGRPVTYSSKKASLKFYDYFKYLTQSYVPLPAQAYTGWNIAESMLKDAKKRKTNKTTTPRTPTQELIKFGGLNSLTYSTRGLKREQDKGR